MQDKISSILQISGIIQFNYIRTGIILFFNAANKLLLKMCLILKILHPNQVGLFFKATGQTDISVSTLHNADLNFNYNKKCIHKR